ncbi:hypothetical protein E1956_45550 (plasmid) [Paraburkholderia pallida]|uniref:Uncharacterized protein n=1 Tax=Paraburkholderia pallida TaxID=2547399 RepID=A0A4P7DC29_9BURK|nr:hypothetical protein E1956_45550 [Paraburkholderia pallida]
MAVLLALINQILTSAFALLAHENHPEIAPGLTLLFNLTLFVILIVWIRQDSKHAWRDACESGFVSPCVIQNGRTVRIRRGCARRWLVALHVELQSGFASKA